MIPESTIDLSIDWVSQNIEQATKNFIEDFPELTRYLYSGKFDLLTNEENELLLFLFLVINHSIEDENIENFSLDLFHSKEEKNWDLFENKKQISWQEKLNMSFDNYKEEDLLAFVEDLLTEEEGEEILSQIGKEFIFVTVKSFIDIF